MSSMQEYKKKGVSYKLLNDEGQENNQKNKREIKKEIKGSKESDWNGKQTKKIQSVSS